MVNRYNFDLNFYKGKSVFVTGHTGFKGTWLCKILEMAGAKVTGFALPSPTEEGAKVFKLSGVEDAMQSFIGDIRDYQALYRAFFMAQPEAVFHLAAQPIVRESYKDPMGTYDTNVMGTVHVLECIRNSDCVKSFLNITTDKVYENKEQEDKAYEETEPLDGYDPYSNSKSCSELVTHSYKKSFFADGKTAISTARAGNVIGGGDFAVDRIIPDCIRAVYANKEITVRNPYSTRPYQHVLEPLFVYLMIAAAQEQDGKYAGYYNVGPDECDCVTTGKLVDLFCKYWDGNQTWKNLSVGGPHEAKFLKLNCDKLKTTFGWQPRWHIDEAVAKTVEWAKVYQKHGDIAKCMVEEIKEFEQAGGK
jgi:CDP-glucose 4,6-dehydratase